MAFPATPLGVTVELALGADLTADPSTWTWTDITPYVYARDPIQITRGRSDEFTTAQPTRIVLTVNNAGGRFSRLNPTGPYYGLLSRNTPLRVKVDPGTGPVVRAVGFVDELPPRWDVSGKDTYVALTASGITRRLQQGAVLRSAMYRAITTTGPAAYWPIEDGSASTQAANAVLDGAPLMVVKGTVRFAGDTGPAGSGPVADLRGGGELSAPLPSITSTSYRIEFAAKFSTFAAGDYSFVLDWYTADNTLWEIAAWPQVDGGLGLQYSDSAGNPFGPFTSNVAVDDGVWHHVRVDMSQSGSNTTAKVYLDGALVINQATAQPWSPPTKVVVDPSGAPNEALPTVGHLAVWGPWSSTVDTLAAFKGYAGETAGARFTRLCGEEGITGQVSGTSSSTATVGAQTVASFLTLARAAEAADQGLLYEDATSPALILRARTAQYNRSVALTLDYAAGQVAPPMQPTDDDQRLRNDWTVKRTNGSSARYVADTGPLGTASVGVYNDEVTVDLASDGDLLYDAQWRVHLGTTDDLRWPQVPINLAAQPSLISGWLGCDIGARLQVTNPPAELAPDTIDQQIEGYSETLGPFTWSVVANCSPAQPWQVWTIEGAGNTGRFDTDGSTLAAAVTATATSLSVAAVDATKPLWTTDAAQMPFDINIDGERITVTAITGGSSPQAFTVTRSVNGVVKSHLSGAAVSLWRPSVLAL